MKEMESMKKYAPIPALVLLAGCLTASQPEHADWNIECTDRAAQVAEKPKFGVARLILVELRAPYNVRDIAVLRANGSIAFDPCNGYASAPVQLVKGVAMESLERSGLFKAVVGSGSTADADVDAELAVTRLALDCREEGVRRAVATLSLRLVRAHRIVDVVTGEGAADASQTSDFSAAFSAAVTDAFSEALRKL